MVFIRVVGKVGKDVERQSSEQTLLITGFPTAQLHSHTLVPTSIIYLGFIIMALWLGLALS